MPDVSYQVLPPINGDDAGLLSSCPYATQDQATPSADVEANFGTSLIGPGIVTEEMQQYPVSVAEEQMRQFAETASQCSSFITSLDGFAVTVSLAPEAMSRLGDGTVALSLAADVRAKTGDVSIATDTDIVAVRKGGTVMIITNTAPQLDHAVTRTLVQTAYRNLAALYPAGS